MPGPARVPGPATRKPETFTIHSDDGKAGSNLEQLEERLRRAEAQLAVRDAAAAGVGSVGSATPGPDALAAVMERQTGLLEKALNRPQENRRTNSTIKVEPKVQWPHLGDDGPGGKEVNEFYNTFENICGLANNAQGMADREMLVALKSCMAKSKICVALSITASAWRTARCWLR